MWPAYMPPCGRTKRCSHGRIIAPPRYTFLRHDGPHQFDFGGDCGFFTGTAARDGAGSAGAGVP